MSGPSKTEVGPERLNIVVHRFASLDETVRGAHCVPDAPSEQPTTTPSYGSKSLERTSFCTSIPNWDDTREWDLILTTNWNGSSTVVSKALDGSSTGSNVKVAETVSPG
jgi:hypothetical protein